MMNPTSNKKDFDELKGLINDAKFSLEEFNLICKKLKNNRE